MTRDAIADIPALISSRICHDLISPIGAISNGLELLGEINPDPMPELALVLDSTETAKAKIAFFRLAFGNAGDDDDIVSGSVEPILAAMFANGRFRPVWTVEEATLPRAEVKLAMLLTLGIEASLPLGGSTTIACKKNQWTLDTTGPRVTPDERLWSWVTDAAGEGSISPRDVQFALAGETAQRLGRSVTMSAGEAGMRVAF